jgi:hypothetical protein
MQTWTEKLEALWRANAVTPVCVRLTYSLTHETERLDWLDEPAQIEFVSGLDPDAPDDENGNLCRVNGTIFEVIKTELWFSLLELWVRPLERGCNNG